MGDVCPKCGKPFVGRGYFGRPDHLGIIGMVMHKKKWREPVTIGGITEPGSWQYTERCFLTVDEWKKLFPGFRHDN